MISAGALGTSDNIYYVTNASACVLAGPTKLRNPSPLPVFISPLVSTGLAKGRGVAGAACTIQRADGLTL